MVESKNDPQRCAADTGQRTPPNADRRSRRSSTRGRPKSIDLKTLVQKANAKKIIVKTRAGTMKVSQGDVVLKQMANQAASGNVSAQKIMIKYAKRYLKPPNESDCDTHLLVEELCGSFEFIKAFECIPPDCNALEELSLAEVNAAYKMYRKKFDDPEERKRGFDRMYVKPN